MIALRGTIRHKAGSSTSPTPSTTAPSEPSEPEATSDFNTQTTQPGEWIWTGYWAFGSLPPAEVLDGFGQHKKKKPPSGVRPFVYKFQEFKEAKDVVVPSSLVMSDEDTGEDADGDGDTNVNGNPDNNKGEKEVLSVTKDTIVSDSAKVSNDVKSVQPLGEEKDSAPHVSEIDTQKQERDEIINLKPDGGSEDKNDVSQRVAMDSSKEATVKATDKISSLDKIEIDTNKQDTNNIEDMPIDVQTSTVEKLSKSDKSKNIYHENLSGSEVENKAQEEEEKKINDNCEKKSERESVEEDSNVDGQTTKDKAIRAVGNTFGEVSGGAFTDAGKTYPKVCPIGGCWKGYFENVSKRKDRMSSRVQETFHLFFNSTPPADARVGFVDEEDEGSVNSGGDLPRGQIHVRGAGTNQFGTFEILGGFDAVTGVLSCQRIYVSTSDNADGPTDDKRNADEKEKSTRGSPSRKPVRKSYFTRKRPVASWRTTSYGAYDDIYDTGTGRSNSGRKRQRTTSEPSAAKVVNTGAGDTIGAPKSSDTSTQPAFSSSKTTGTSSSAEPLVNQNITNEAPMKVDNTTPSSTARRPSPGKSPSSRKHRSSPSSTARSSPSVNSSAYQIKIPKSGNPLDARWRAAHFIYFQRHVENQESSSPTNTPVATTTNYVVYEGEMNSGKNLRDGRGVCLYNNGTLYEGEWKKNKEHGNGTLLTGDRKRIIYSGDWERGKMHGRGTYYYHMYANPTEEADPKKGGVYSGDFKENARHGVGTYTLPGGNVYSGDWRENVPCGKGTFTWFDDSKYDGMWKDGKRNGWGQLHCSDGFQYDGMWVDNAMEGRGRAVYPNGQQYDGMWLNGKRDGRGTIIFGNGAVYKGRFKEDGMEGQGTLKVDRNVSVSPVKKESVEPLSNEAKDSSSEEHQTGEKENEQELLRDDWMIPIEFQSDIGRIHEKAGFTTGGE